MTAIVVWLLSPKVYILIQKSAERNCATVPLLSNQEVRSLSAMAFSVFKKQTNANVELSSMW